MSQRGHSGDGCDLAPTLCKYDLRKGDLFVLSWAKVQRVSRASISSELLMCGGSVCSIWLSRLVARCLETIDVCIRHMFVFIYVVGLRDLWKERSYSNFQIFSQNYQFHHRLLESLDHVYVFFKIIILHLKPSATRDKSPHTPVHRL